MLVVAAVEDITLAQEQQALADLVVAAMVD
jgi:hypothetical protein